MARSKDDVAEVVADEAAPDAEVKPAHRGAGRPNDVEIADALYPNSTLGSRAKARAKRVSEAQNKAVRSADSK